MLTFQCPKCKRFCAVVDDYAGRRVRCMHCSCRFIVPAKQDQPAKIYLEPPQPPLPAFYREALVGSWKAIFARNSIIGLIYCLAMTCFQFFIGDRDYSFTAGNFRPPLILGWIVQFFTLGGLCWYFFQTIANTLLYPESLPELDIGSGFEYLANLFKSLFFFINAIFLAMLPGLAVSTVLEHFGMLTTPINIVLFCLSSLFLALFWAIFGSNLPIWAVYRIDLIAIALYKTFRPYLFTAVITSIAFICWVTGLWMFETQEDITFGQVVYYLVWRIISVLLMLYAMRVIGLYCRHYKPVTPRLWSLTDRD